MYVDPGKTILGSHCHAILMQFENHLAYEYSRLSFASATTCKIGFTYVSTFLTHVLKLLNGPKITR